MHVICKNSHMSTKCVCQGGSKTCDPKSSSILAELAGFPTTLVAFLYGLRVWKYTCTISISSDVTTFVFETVIGYVWDKIVNLLVQQYLRVRILCYEIGNILIRCDMYICLPTAYSIKKYNLPFLIFKF